MVLLTFPSASIAREFMESDHAPVRKMREDNSTTLVILEGI